MLFDLPKLRRLQDRQGGKRVYSFTRNGSSSINFSLTERNGKKFGLISIRRFLDDPKEPGAIAGWVAFEIEHIAEMRKGIELLAAEIEKTKGDKN